MEDAEELTPTSIKKNLEANKISNEENLDKSKM
jgi:hypothetical protein